MEDHIHATPLARHRLHGDQIKRSARSPGAVEDLHSICVLGTFVCKPSYIII